MYTLFKWSTPGRRNADRILPVIPNEIYLHIFEHIAPPSGRLTPEELGTITNLSLVCRLFANICLPRIFEFLEFSGSVFRDGTLLGLRHDAVYKESRESTLCTQIAAKQPLALALALAKTVGMCRFTDWTLDGIGAWAVQLFVKKYITAMLHMRNIHTLEFFNSFVDAEHWGVIATLGSLKELSFCSCEFLNGPADVEPEKRVKVKVSCLRVTDCTGNRQPIAAIDIRYLRSLAMDHTFFQRVNWLPHSSLTELCFYHWRSVITSPDLDIEQLHDLLLQVPRSLKTLDLSLHEHLRYTPDLIRSIFDGLGWKNLTFLHSLTLRFQSQFCHTPSNELGVFSSALEGINLTELQSFMLEDHRVKPRTSEIHRILYDKLGPTSRLKYVDIYGIVLHFVDGKWSEMPSSAA